MTKKPIRIVTLTFTDKTMPSVFGPFATEAEAKNFAVEIQKTFRNIASTYVASILPPEMFV